MYGLSDGHWRQVVQTGSARTITFFDALWRPVVKETRDMNDPWATLAQTVTRYDAEGRASFASYPQRTGDPAVYNTWGDPGQSPNALGVSTSYDALDRVTQVDQHSELGILRTTTQYLPSFQTRVTDPRQQVTTTAYVTYDQPTTDQVAWVAHPLGATTHFARDVFGKPIWMARTGTAGEWSGRYYSYDEHQRLCKQRDLETSATAMGYDDAGNLAWSASGLPWLPDDTCVIDTTGRRIDRTYDARNRIKTLRFPEDGNGNQDWSYYPDGLPSQVSTWNVPATGSQPTLVNNSYQYNKRRLLTGETATQPGWYSFSLGYGYDGHANLASQTYPSGLSITYYPNALGQATQVAGNVGGVSTSYATGVSYYPNGAITQFTYGSGIVHAMLQNERQLPSWVTGSSITHFSYNYDANSNVTQITDYAHEQNGRQTRSMTYDALDRLETASSPMFGGALTYGYDRLDNITSVVGPDRNHRYCYSGGHHLLFVRSNSAHCEDGAAVTALEYDIQGNVKKKNQVNYRFDFGNRLREASSTEMKERYRYDAHGRRVLASRILGPTDTLGVIFSQYANSGQLMYQENERPAVSRKTDHIYLGGSLIAQRETPLLGGASTVKYQHTDALGSPIAVINANGTAVLERFEYEPYGKSLFGGPLTTAPKDGPGYTGHVLDAATGMNYMQQRYYDPGIGRFLSVDPVTANSSTGDNFNRYWYANNNPYRFTDPDGRAPCEYCSVVADRVWGAVSGGPMQTAGQAIAADTAYIVGAATGNQALQDVAIEGMRENVSASDGVSAAMMAGGRSGGGKTFTTYTRSNGSTVYSGKTSGKGSPQEQVAARLKGSDHRAKTNEGYGPGVVDKNSPNADAISGREQQLIQQNGGAQSQGGTSGNKINAASPSNPKTEARMKACKKEFGC